MSADQEQEKINGLRNALWQTAKKIGWGSALLLQELVRDDLDNWLEIEAEGVEMRLCWLRAALGPGPDPAVCDCPHCEDQRGAAVIEVEFGPRLEEEEEG